jgi:arylsulfatase A-like enzyme
MPVFILLRWFRKTGKKQYLKLLKNSINKHIKMKTHKQFLIVLATVPLAGFISSCNSSGNSSQEHDTVRPNIIYILADDLGYGDLGCYGQEKIHTPNLDRMAAEGILFTQHYSGSTVCAPSRSSLMTGMHTGHTYIRGNNETYPEGQKPIAAEAITIAEVLKEAGYATGAFGKWSLGMHDTEGSPVKQGFDTFIGFLCQRYAHRYYHQYIWHNEDTLFMEGNDFKNKVTYVPDVIHERTLDFIRSNKDKPFFLYVPSIIPHAEILAPDDSILQMYAGKWPEEPWGIVSDNPYQGNDYGAENFVIEGYAPIDEPRAHFAAMVTRLDYQVGDIIDLVKELGIAENTLILFTSDNGAHTEGGADPEFFNSSGPFKGTKRDLYEGGIRTPFIGWWPGVIKAGSRSDHISAFWDMMPTFAELAGIEPPDTTDGISLVPVLTGKGDQAEHEYMYWEFYERGGRLAVRKGDWKLVKYNIFQPGKETTELYNLAADISEQNNLAEQNPDIVAELMEIMKEAHIPNKDYKMPMLE